MIVIYWMFWENVLRSLGIAIRILIPELNHPRKFHIHIQYLLLPFPALTHVYSIGLTSSCTTKSFVTESKLPSMCGNPLEHSLTHHKITLAKTPALHWVTLHRLVVTMATDGNLLLKLHACAVMVWYYYVFVRTWVILRIGKRNIDDIL